MELTEVNNYVARNGVFAITLLHCVPTAIEKDIVLDQRKDREHLKEKALLPIE